MAWGVGGEWGGNTALLNIKLQEVFKTPMSQNTWSEEKKKESQRARHT